MGESPDALHARFSPSVAAFEGRYSRSCDIELFPRPKQEKLLMDFGGYREKHLRRPVEGADRRIPAAIGNRQLFTYLIDI